MTIWALLSWAVLAALLVILAAGVSWVMGNRRVSAGNAMDDGSWEFSPENYRGMEGLFAEEDLACLASQPGYRAELGARWKRERYHLFRLYLTELKLDFRRLHARARAMMAHSDAAHADLVGVLMRQEAAFLWALAGVEFRLLLHRTGWGKVDITPLVELMESMRVDLAMRGAPQAA